MLEVVAARDDDVLVPPLLIDSLFDLLGAADRAGDLFLALLVPGNLFAALSHDAARHTLFIQDAGVVGSGFHIGLVAADDPVGRVKNLAAILNAGIGEARVVIGRHAE